MAENIKHGPYITELAGVTSMYRQINADQISVLGGKDLGGTKFSLGLSYLTEPFLMVAEAHAHDFDQILFFLGGDPADITRFDAKVEMSLGDPAQRHIITYPACVHIPAGLVHCPLNFVAIERPIIFIDVTLATGASVRPLPPTSRRDV